jgi:hypothetical protein
VCLSNRLQAMPAKHLLKDTFQVSTPGQAMAFLDSIRRLDSSRHWPNVDPELFLQNLKTYVITPLQFYEGKRTNFCSYSALTYFPLRYDPLGFSRFMIRLYQNGEAGMGKIFFRPEAAIKNEAGLLKYKGALDLSPAGQMWFLCLADHFKGYLNFFNRHFDKGDENTLWAATNFAKFNRMLRKLFSLTTRARGSDLLRPWVGNRYSFLQKKMNKGIVFLYLNNRLLYKKKHMVTRLGIPTHYVLLLDIYKTDNDKINIVYWDYGRKTLQQLDARFLRKIIFGITYCPFGNK